ncbi:hypothetical protein COO91_01352 [Nostoc flagelliforme CCNUN1]|uniref:Uncharacterized protein n=1 Tax=Nostoc flagelliforme CCNUN1 TaxID=2038116 RepID=A0A2K8SJ59_9NOSO|nr:hypothetical protein COO91_01352 [Nostoc flagelliforme CCNUN1]
MYLTWQQSCNILYFVFCEESGYRLNRYPNFNLVGVSLVVRFRDESGVKGKGEGGKGLNPKPSTLSPFPSPHKCIFGLADY